MGKRHNPLIPSEPDDVMLVRTVEHNFLDLCGIYLRVEGRKLEVPGAMKPAFLLWRSARVRHMKSDFRHTADEMKATRDVAQWTVDLNCKMRNQPSKTIEWADG